MSSEAMPRRRTRRLTRAAVALCAAVVGIGTAIAADGPERIDRGASASELAERRLPEIVDVVTLHDSGPLDQSTRDRAIAAANAAGARWSVVQTVSSALTRISRGGTTIQAAPTDFSFPMSTTFLDAELIETIMHPDVLVGLNEQTLVMSSGTAGLRGARAGDVVTLRHVAGGTRDFTISQIVHDSITGGTELLMLPSAAARLGVSRESRVMIWDFADRDSIMNALVGAGAVASASAQAGAIFDPPGSPRPIRLRRSWDPRDPDGTLGWASTKSVLGEFAYRVNDNGSVSVDGSWASINIPSSRESIGIGILARCHRTIQPGLRAALAEIAARGLSGTMDVGDANVAGGCFVPRFNRLAPDSNVGFLSRHTWGMAIDINTRNDCQGCDPPSLATRSGGCETVRIFRKHGFSWGGNYTTPDGMHFEYVGEDRSQIPYPSRFCANSVPFSAFSEELPLEWTERAVLFADAGLIDGHATD